MKKGLDFCIFIKYNKTAAKKSSPDGVRGD